MAAQHLEESFCKGQESFMFGQSVAKVGFETPSDQPDSSCSAGSTKTALDASPRPIS